MAEEKEKKKVKLPTAEKRVIQTEKKTLVNKTFKSKVRTAVRSFEEAISKKDDSAKEKLNAVYAMMDKGVKKGTFKLNKASRIKARFSKRLAAK